MNSLELSVPPVAVALLIAGGMGGVSELTSPLDLPDFLRLSLSLMLVASGAWISLIAVGAFRQANTTVNPTKPDSTSALVCTGVYRYTRNPMYLGFLLILCGLGIFLVSPPAFIGPAVFVLYMNRFQIVPEERALAAHFGDEFVRYQRQVRRWC